MEKVFTKIAIVFFAILSILTFFFTTYIVDYEKFPMQIKFAPQIIFGIIIFIFAIKHLPNFRHPYKFIFLYALIFSVAWFIIANVQPMWDSLDLVNAAEYLNHNYNELALTKWAPGSYMTRFPFQTPLVLTLYILIKFFGRSTAIIIFQILNCFAIAISACLIVKLTDQYFKNQKASRIAVIFTALFLPFIFYSTFIYGNIIAIAFVLAGLYFESRHIETNKKKYLVFMTLSLILAVLIKSTMLLIVFAVAVVYFVRALKKHSLKLAIFAVILPLLAHYAVLPINSFVEFKTKTNLRSGVPTIAWIAMGIGAGQEYYADQTGDESARTSVAEAGYYDAFVWALDDVDYTPEKISELSKTYIEKRLEHYKQDPGLAFSYFVHKLLIEWTEPTYEALLASNWYADNAPDGYIMYNRTHNKIAEHIYYGKVNTMLIYIMDTVQTLLVAGVLAILLKRKTKNWTIIIYILGTALTYFFWENKTQYLLSAYLLMIPYAAAGWQETTEFIRQQSFQSCSADDASSPHKSSPHTRRPAQAKSSATHPKSKSNK